MLIILMVAFCFSCSKRLVHTETGQCLISKSVINQFILFMKESYPQYEEVFEKGFSFNEKNCTIIGFIIHDLTVSESFNSLEDRDFVIVDGHVYHFYVSYPPYSFSNIAYMDNGDVVFFRNITCQDEGESLDEALGFVSSKLGSNPNFPEISNRIRNHRQYLISGQIDDIIVELDCSGL